MGIGPTGTVPARMLPTARISRLVDAALEAAPDCLREGVILQSIDWSAVAPAKVAMMLSSLQRARVACPRWLSRSLLLAGHVVTVDLDRHLPSPMKVLHRINRAHGKAQERQEIAVMLGALLSVAVTLPWALPFTASGRDLLVLAALGVFQLGLPCMLLVLVSRTLTAPEIALLALLEVVLGPLWAWLGAGEAPGYATVMGGLIVLGALAGNELAALMQRKRV
jgi:hypothetical protein